MESNTNNISSAGLHGTDQSQRRAETSEEVDIRQGQNALGSLSLSTGLTPSTYMPTEGCRGAGEVSVRRSGDSC